MMLQKWRIAGGQKLAAGSWQMVDRRQETKPGRWMMKVHNPQTGDSKPQLDSGISKPET
jgi:hypothetical protein